MFIRICFNFYLEGQSVLPQSLRTFGSAGHCPSVGVGVNLHLYSKAPLNICIPSVPNKRMMNIKKITTLPRAGRESIRDPTNSLIPIYFNFFK